MRRLALLALLAAGALPGVSAACTLAVTGVSFGPIDPLANQVTTSVGSVQVECPADTPYLVRLSTGASGSWSRTLSSGADSLAYNLFRDPTHVEVWGDGSGGSLTVSGLGSGSTQLHSVYGRVPAQPQARVGSYSDVVVVTLEF